MSISPIIDQETMEETVYQRARAGWWCADPCRPLTSRGAPYGGPWQQWPPGPVSPGNADYRWERLRYGRRAWGATRAAREAIKVGFDYCKANASHVSASAKPGDHDFHLHVVELHNAGPTTAMTLAAFVALCSGLLGKPVQSQLVILGSMSLGGNLIPGPEPGRSTPGCL